jgi:hypothetical protein
MNSVTFRADDTSRFWLTLPETRNKMTSAFNENEITLGVRYFSSANNLQKTLSDIFRVSRLSVSKY